MSRPLAVMAVATQNGRISCFEFVQSLLMLILQISGYWWTASLPREQSCDKICLFLRVDEDYGQLGGVMVLIVQDRHQSSFPFSQPLGRSVSHPDRLRPTK